MNQREAKEVLRYFHEEFKKTYHRLAVAKERLEKLSQDALYDSDGEFLEATATLKLDTDGGNPGQWVIKSMSEVIEHTTGQVARFGVLICVVGNISRRGDK